MAALLSDPPEASYIHGKPAPRCRCCGAIWIRAIAPPGLFASVELLKPTCACSRQQECQRCARCFEHCVCEPFKLKGEI
jgi:hypothetical protein